jgi:hypothetical protein
MQRYFLNFCSYKKKRLNHNMYFFIYILKQKYGFLFFKKDLGIYTPNKTHFVFVFYEMKNVLEIFEISMKSRYFNTRSASYTISL